MKQDTDELLAQHSDARDRRITVQIAANRRNQWKPNAVKMQCVGCRFSDIHVVVNDRPNMWGTPWGTHVANELSIYCVKKARIVKYPYEKCPIRQEKPKVTIDNY